MARGNDWTDQENSLLVADYFEMLQLDAAKREYSKAEYNRRLTKRIDRSRASIEFKHRNVSAVLQGLGEVWLQGYVPAASFQMSLVDAVMSWMEKSPEWMNRPPGTFVDHFKSELREEGSPLWVGPPPTQSNSPPPADLDKLMEIAKRFNVAERDERNRALGRAGELRVLNHERATLSAAGRSDLAEKVKWTSEDFGDGAGYDIASFENDGREKLIEVKTTRGWERTPFYISRNEYDVANENRDAWCLLRLWNFDREPKAFEIRPPLERHVSLVATNFRATPN
ncbi:DUF3883 domain-containing protein [Notoacmeibacter sp. MSK16QG-6]|uniref:DUF3883 domain-containing protein n=1 Tax=Notoacmeibacter sp. MSK16QG-6 TaxID=2957982 RepID=UPI00209DE24C|nr:DUF3883 domain-containing protein [Notoacmeibacter sp. MSK16QG-6]MCP1200950.1 DUF3883 domain-containing protein [Notoacmeibacter sp. MSK16QG-6]